jgi:hypothetical protein
VILAHFLRRKTCWHEVVITSLVNKLPATHFVLFCLFFGFIFSMSALSVQQAGEKAAQPGPSLDSRDEHGRTKLFYAVLAGDVAAARRLLEVSTV